MKRSSIHHAVAIFFLAIAVIVASLSDEAVEKHTTIWVTACITILILGLVASLTAPEDEDSPDDYEDWGDWR